MEFRVTLEWEATVGGRRVERSWEGVNGGVAKNRRRRAVLSMLRVC